MHQHQIYIFPQCNLILYNIKSLLTRWYVIWNMNARRVSNQGAIQSLYNALCRTEYLQAFSTDEPEKFDFFYCIYVCICSGDAHLTSADCFPFCFLSDHFFFLSIFSSEVHLPCHSPQCSALHCTALPFRQQSGHAVPSPDPFLLFFFNAIDPFSNMQVYAWCSVYWRSDWHKLFKLFFFHMRSVNSKDIGGWVGGELGVGCRARVKGGWQTRLNCFKIALCSS